MIVEIIKVMAVLILTYFIGHGIRYTTKLNFCSKCFAIVVVLIGTILNKYNPIIIGLLAGGLMTISKYYLDDYLVKKRNIDIIMQDFILYLVLFFLTAVILWRIL